MNAPGVLSNDVVTYWFTLHVIYSAEVLKYYIVWAKKSKLLLLLVLTSSIMDQFKEIPLFESLLNFQKNALICATRLQNVTT